MKVSGSAGSLGRVLVVEASAGSGKTYALARRYVQLCLATCALPGRELSVVPFPEGHRSPIQSILAITFTNKAAWEMKSRIFDVLKRIALQQLDPREAEDILGPVGLKPQEASRIAFDLMNDVIRQYHYFQVQTIDSFINILLVGCCFKIGLSAKFKIRRNSRDYLELGLDELLENASKDKGLHRLFTDFVRQYLFLENRSGWFPRQDLLKVMTELFRQYNTYQKPLLVYSAQGDVFAHKRKIHGLMQELKNLCPAQTNQRFLEHLDELLDNEDGLFDLDDLKNHWTKEVFPANQGAKIPAEVEKLWPKVLKEICALSLAEAHGMFNPYVEVFDKVLECFTSLSKRDDVLFLEELNRKAALLFDDELVTMEELYVRLAARFRHYLMDEFQDTSLGQWRNLSAMVDEALADNGSFFYVGDKKQAIYAFRGGESRLFDALQARLSSFGVEAVTLEKNFRSCPEIIAFNNEVFSMDNLRAFLQRRLEDSMAKKRDDIHFSQSDFQEIANTFGHAHQFPGRRLKGGVVRVAFLDGRIKQERSADVRRRLIPLVQGLSKRFALKDMAILARGNDEVEEITQWLLKEGIYASSERSSDIKANPVLAELMHLLGFLYSPADNTAFAHLCLGQLVPKATGITAQALQNFLFECARKTLAVEVCFFKEFQAAFPEAWQTFFEDFIRQAGVCPLYNLAAGLIERFGCERHFPQYQGFFMHVLELIKRQETEHCDLSAFLEYYENLEGEDRYVPMAQVNAVKVLTVHKAKGLEFPVAIVPYLEMDIKAGSGGRDGGQAYVLDIQEQGIGLVRIKESYRKFCPELQQRYEQEYKKAFLVELNSMYVALTRAIEELYVFVPGKVGNTVNPAIFLIPEECMARGTPADRPAAHEPAAVAQNIKPFVSGVWPGLQEEFLQQPPKSAAYARVGEFYHAVLMQIERLTEKNVDDVLQKAWEKASSSMMSISAVFASSTNVIPAPAPPLFCEAKLAGKAGIQNIQAFIQRPDVRRFFFLPVEAQVFCEKEFVDRRGDTKRIDRLIVGDKEVWIVDFKGIRGQAPAGIQSEHQRQIQEYAELMRSFYPKHKISGHVLYLGL